MDGVGPDTLQRLVDRLGGDRDEAGRRYQDIHHRLVRLFAWRGQAEPERLADLTIDRVAAKLAQGEEIRAEDPYRYFAGVARLVLAEVVREESRVRRVAAEAAEAAAAEAADALVAREEGRDVEQRAAALERCLEGLGAEARELLLEYHRGRGAARIERRKRLAGTLALGLNALRIRVFRLRERLERCLRGMDRER